MLDEVRFRFDDAGNQELAFGELERLEKFPLVRVARVGGLDRDGARPCTEYDVYHVGQGDVAVMGSFVIAPAQMHAQLLGRNIRGGMIEGLDVQLRLLAPFRKT